MAVEIARPAGAALLATEPVIRSGLEGLDHFRLDPPMPGHDIRRSTRAPAPVDQGVALVDVEALHFRRAFFAAEDSGAVLLPVEDVGQRILDGPRILGLRPRHVAAPVRRLEPLDQPIELPELALRPLRDVLAVMPHRTLAVTRFSGRTRRTPGFLRRVGPPRSGSREGTGSRCRRRAVRARRAPASP